MIEESIVESALEVLRPSLDADGFDLLVGPILADGIVQVVLKAKPGACLDCLVPDDAMINIIEGAIREREPAFNHIQLVKKGFDSVTPH
jgi:Fe-S cluster biogenesis protein NfuA